MAKTRRATPGKQVDAHVYRMESEFEAKVTEAFEAVLDGAAAGPGTGAAR